MNRREPAQSAYGAFYIDLTTVIVQMILAFYWHFCDTVTHFGDVLPTTKLFYIDNTIHEIILCMQVLLKVYERRISCKISVISQVLMEFLEIFI